MTSLYLQSLQPYSGKSAVALGIALELRARGLSVGYFKPLGTSPEEMEGHQVDADAFFMQRTLKLPNPVEEICPVLLTIDLLEAALRGQAPSMRQRVAEVYQSLAPGYDVMLVEGPSGLATGMSLGVPPPEVVGITDARVLLVLHPRGDILHSVDWVLLAQQVFGERLMGAVVNAVPGTLLSRVQEDARIFLERHGLRLFGVLPEDRLLTAMTVGELVDLLAGHILCCAEARGELVLSFVVGAMSAQTAYHFFLRSTDKAVITGGDRSDIQMAALSTPGTRALILTGNLYPELSVVTRARELGVPVVLVPTDTFETVKRVEAAWGQIRVSSPQQVDRLWEIARNRLDFALLAESLGLKL